MKTITLAAVICCMWNAATAFIFPAHAPLRHKSVTSVLRMSDVQCVPFRIGCNKSNIASGSSISHSFSEKSIVHNGRCVAGVNVYVDPIAGPSCHNVKIEWSDSPKK